LNELSLQGVIVDVMEYLGTSSINMTGMEVRDWMLKAFHLFKQYNETKPNAISTEALWKTMIGNGVRAPLIEVNYGPLFEAFKHWCTKPADFVGMARGNEIARVYRNAYEYACATSYLITDRKFGITQDGHPAIIPPRSITGDKIAVILELSTPFVVRECPMVENDDVEQKYFLIGECYVHDLMNGEGIQGRAVTQLIFQ
jgi:hypothetical protein